MGRCGAGGSPAGCRRDFGSRHYQYEMFYAGAPFVAKAYAYRNYGFPDVAQMVDACLAGYDLEHPGA